MMCISTICPTLLTASPNIPVSEIDKQMLDIAENHINKCKSYGIRIHISQEVLDRILEIFPWSITEDKNLLQKVHIWRRVVLTPLQKYSKFIQVGSRNAVAQSNINVCSSICDNHLSHKWEQWLHYLKSGATISGKYIIGISSHANCVNHSHNICHQFIVICNEEDWDLLRYPWYLRYPGHLPSSGERFFTPPNGWETQSIRRGPQNGYLDSSGNEWVWDRYHNNHWDVQLNHSDDHINVTTDGKVL